MIDGFGVGCGWNLTHARWVVLVRGTGLPFNRYSWVVAGWRRTTPPPLPRNHEDAATAQPKDRRVLARLLFPLHAYTRFRLPSIRRKKKIHPSLEPRKDHADI